MTATPRALDIPQIWRERLSARLGDLQMSPAPEIQQRLLEYLALLLQWNAAYNLTAVR